MKWDDQISVLTLNLQFFLLSPPREICGLVTLAKKTDTFFCTVFLSCCSSTSARFFSWCTRGSGRVSYNHFGSSLLLWLLVNLPQGQGLVLNCLPLNWCAQHSIDTSRSWSSSTSVRYLLDFRKKRLPPDNFLIHRHCSPLMGVMSGSIPWPWRSFRCLRGNLRCDMEYPFILFSEIPMPRYSSFRGGICTFIDHLHERWVKDFQFCAWSNYFNWVKVWEGFSASSGSLAQFPALWYSQSDESSKRSPQTRKVIQFLSGRSSSLELCGQVYQCDD